MTVIKYVALNWVSLDPEEMPNKSISVKVFPQDDAAIKIHTVILPDRTLKKWGLSNAAF